MLIRRTRINLSMLLFASALLSLTACGTMAVSTEHPPAHQGEPTTTSTVAGYRLTRKRWGRRRRLDPNSDRRL